MLLQDGASLGKQKILDVHRAKWHSYRAMNLYYRTHVQALVDEGIAYWNKAYNESDKDELGIPKQPIAFWIPGEEWR